MINTLRLEFGPAYFARRILEHPPRCLPPSTLSYKPRRSTGDQERTAEKPCAMLFEVTCLQPQLTASGETVSR